LLAPGFVESTGVDRVEAKLIDQFEHDLFRRGVVAGYRQRDAARGASGLTIFKQMLRIDVVKYLDHWMSQLLLDPPALRQTGLDRFDSAITLARIIVASIDDDAPDRVREQTGGQFGDVLLGNRKR
jgi:hypothetical protein